VLLVDPKKNPPGIYAAGGFWVGLKAGYLDSLTHAPDRRDGNSSGRAWMKLRSSASSPQSSGILYRRQPLFDFG
jgi:hypothetical protein